MAMTPMFVPEASLMASYCSFVGVENQEPKNVSPPPGLEHMCLGAAVDACATTGNAPALVPFVVEPSQLWAHDLAQDLVNDLKDLPILSPQMDRKELCGKTTQLAKSFELAEDKIYEEANILEEDAILAPIICEAHARILPSLTVRTQHCNRWWASSNLPCPLSNFPICLLPYPPFKLRMHPGKAGSHKWFDGKFLALTMIASGQMNACGRTLESTDVESLDEYMHRCKLGTCRPGRAVRLEKEANAPGRSAEERQQSTNDLNALRAFARSELVKLRRVQQRRHMRLIQEMNCGNLFAVSQDFN